VRNGTTGSLSLATLIFEPDAMMIEGPKVNQSHLICDLRFSSGSERNQSFDLAPTEGFALIARVAALAAGDLITGHVEWDERIA
jgi:hypothetical protein